MWLIDARSGGLPRSAPKKGGETITRRLIRMAYGMIARGFYFILLSPFPRTRNTTAGIVPLV
jgi:hypothetical protein